MTWNELKHCVNADLFRYFGGIGRKDWLMAWRFEAGFRLTVAMRLCRYARERPWLRWTLYFPLRFWFNRLSMKLKVFLDPLAEIGPGLYLGHPFMIIVNHRVKIGSNFSLGHEVTLGIGGRGDRRGCPKVGDRVYIGPGAKVFGPLVLGDDCAVGANAVVTHDVPQNAVAVGIPAKVISMKGSGSYVTNILAK